MDELQPIADAAPTHYEPGLPLSETTRAALGRFLPATAVGVASALALLEGMPGAGEWPAAIASVLVGAGALTAGYATGLELLRRRLYPDAEVGGRRSILAGVLAPAAVFLAMVLGGPIAGAPQLLGLLFLVAMALAVVMFFAWLSPTPEEMREDSVATRPLPPPHQ